MRRVGVVVRALAFHQCVPGSIPGPAVIHGLKQKFGFINELINVDLPPLKIQSE